MTSSVNMTSAAGDGNKRPYAAEFDPPPDSSGVKTDTEISLHVMDIDNGIDMSSIKMIVEGAEVKPVITGNKMDFKLAYKPPQNFTVGKKVNVTVAASDLASPPLELVYVYSFETCLNNLPVFIDIGDKVVYQNELLEFPVQVIDPDGDNLTIAVSGLPAGAVFNTSSLVFSWVPDNTGVFNVEFTADDGKSCGTQAVKITIEPARPLKTNVVYYGRHDSAVQTRIIAFRPEYLTVNTAHSLWGEIYGYSTWWLIRDVSEYREAGIKVIGYITSGYEGTGSGSGMPREWYTLEMNKKLIKNMAEIDKVDGVFIDECSAYPGTQAKVYLKELTEYAHSYGLITWGNAGQPYFDSWYFTSGGFDFMHADEQWYKHKLSPVQTDFGSRISVTGYRADYTVDDAVNLTLDAWDAGLSYCYICQTGYSALPDWFEEYGRRIRLSGKMP